MTDTEPPNPDRVDMRSIMREMERVRRPSRAMLRLGMAWQVIRAVAFVAVFGYVYYNPKSDVSYLFAGYLLGDFSIMIMLGFRSVIRNPAPALFDLGAFAGLIALLGSVGTLESHATDIEGIGLGAAFMGYLATAVFKLSWHGLVELNAEDH